MINQNFIEATMKKMLRKISIRKLSYPKRQTGCRSRRQKNLEVYIIHRKNAWFLVMKKLDCNNKRMLLMSIGNLRINFYSKKKMNKFQMIHIFKQEGTFHEHFCTYKT